MTASAALSQGGRTKNTIDTPRVVDMSAIAQSFVRQGIARWRSHSVTIGPKVRWCRSHRWNRGEERAKHAAARSMNGVVGSKGSTIPAMPSPTDTNPAAMSATRTARESWTRAGGRPADGLECAP